MYAYFAQIFCIGHCGTLRAEQVCSVHAIGDNAMSGSKIKSISYNATSHSNWCDNTLTITITGNYYTSGYSSIDIYCHLRDTCFIYFSTVNAFKVLGLYCPNTNTTNTNDTNNTHCPNIITTMVSPTAQPTAPTAPPTILEGIIHCSFARDFGNSNCFN